MYSECEDHNIILAFIFYLILFKIFIKIWHLTQVWYEGLIMYELNVYSHRVQQNSINTSLYLIRIFKW